MRSLVQAANVIKGLSAYQLQLPIFLHFKRIKNVLFYDMSTKKTLKEHVNKAFYLNYNQPLYFFLFVKSNTKAQIPPKLHILVSFILKDFSSSTGLPGSAPVLFCLLLSSTFFLPLCKQQTMGNVSSTLCGLFSWRARAPALNRCSYKRLRYEAITCPLPSACLSMVDGAVVTFWDETDAIRI